MISERNRLDPSLLDEEQINQLAAAFSTPGHVAVINSEGEKDGNPGGPVRVSFPHAASDQGEEIDHDGAGG